MFKFSCTIFLLALVQCLKSQSDLVPIRLSSNDGLSTDEVRYIYQDREKFLWFCTPEGLNRFDGLRFTVYKPHTDENESFSSRDLTCMCEDHKGNLWIGTRNRGVDLFNRVNNHVKNISFGGNKLRIVSNNIKALLCDRKGDIWIGTGQGLHRYNAENEKMESFTLSKEKSSQNTINCIFEDSKDRIWVGTWNGLNLFEPKTKTFRKYYYNDLPKINNANVVRSIFEDNHGKIWIGSWNYGLYRIDTIINDKLKFKNFKLLTSENKFYNDLIFSIEQDNLGRLWLGTPYGAIVMENPDSSNPRILKLNLGNNIPQTIFNVFKDESGIIWLGSLGAGIFKIDFNTNHFKRIPIPFKLSDRYNQMVYSILPLEHNELLLGIKDIGLGILNLETEGFKSFTELGGLENLSHDFNTAYSLMQDKEKNIWIGTRYKGLYIWNRERKTLSVPTNFKYNENSARINSIIQDSKLNIWVGSGDGVFKYVPDNSKDGYSMYCYRSNKANSLSGNEVNIVYQDRKNRIWIGTENDGLNLLETSLDEHVNPKFKNYDVSDGKRGILSGVAIYSLYADEQDRLWIGTGGGGLNMLDLKTNTFSYYGLSDGLPGDAVFSIVPDSSKLLWISTNKGICRFNPAKKNGEQFEIFTPEDGIQSNIFIRNSFAKLSNNQIVFGGNNGLNIFSPNRIKQNTYIPPVVISNIKVMNEPITVDQLKDGLILNYKQKQFSIEFAALSYSQPLKNRFFYKLEGFEKSWVFADASSRIAYYSNLPSGKYKFMVRAANNSNVWNNMPTVLEIIVKPAPYETIWAKLIYSLIVILVIWGLYKFLIYKTKLKHQLEIEHLERVKVEKINRFKLLFYTNISHELLTPLTILKSSIEQLKKGKGNTSDAYPLMERNIDRLIKLIEQILYFRKIDTGELKLNVEISSFSSFLNTLCNNFSILAQQKSIEFNVRIEPSEIKGYFDVDKLDKIMHNLLSNAFKYTPEGGKIEVVAILQEKSPGKILQISVADTGIGIHEKKLKHIFERFYRVKENSNVPGSGIGLELTRNLVHLHNGTINVTSTEGKGSTFSISLPLAEMSYKPNQISVSNSETDIQPHKMTTEHPFDDNSGRKKITILIAEDNEDFRHILERELSEIYTVVTFGNGKDALIYARQHNPTLIISDIIMPEIDGIKFCEAIKSSEETSHIPVILLTAKTNDEERALGYVFGADSYITKPVSLEVVKARVKALLDQREKLKTFFKAKPEIEPENVSLTSTDEKYLQRAKEIMDKNMDNPDFGVTEFVKEMGTSNSMLYRKLSSLLGLSPNDFIKSMRMKRAAQLLHESKYSISEVAYATGFNNLGYFSICFKKYFNTTPSEYIDQLKNTQSEN